MFVLQLLYVEYGVIYKDVSAPVIQDLAEATPCNPATKSAVLKTMKQITAISFSSRRRRERNYSAGHVGIF